MSIAPVLPLLSEPWPPGRHAKRPCPVCGQLWFPWAFSRLPCHASCLFSAEHQHALLDRLEEGGTTQAALAAELGVTVSVLLANVQKAISLRARVRRSVDALARRYRQEGYPPEG